MDWVLVIITSLVVVSFVALAVTIYRVLPKKRSRKEKFKDEYLEKTASSICKWELTNKGITSTAETEKEDFDRFSRFLKSGNQAFLEMLMREDNE